MKRILFVDAGNYSRSPAADVIAKTQWEQEIRLGLVEISSAGLKDKHVDGPADPRTLSECAARGYDLAAFRCRQITLDEFTSCDLILAMDRSNLDALRAMAPMGAPAVIELFIPDGEVPDPYFGGADGFATAIDLIEERIKSLGQHLFGRV